MLNITKIQVHACKAQWAYRRKVVLEGKLQEGKNLPTYDDTMALHAMRLVAMVSRH